MEMFSKFDPFDKDISKLESQDLFKLRNVHEGWFVDYKKEALSPRNYAKAISAMANTYGGWIFVGVQECSRDNNVAGNFPGIASDRVDETCQHIRQSVAEHLNPQPFFELKTVEAPNKTKQEKVICLYVPASRKPPIIHSDGKIYRRINDSSEPVPENKREAVEHLFQRTKKLEQQYSDWYDDDPKLSIAEKNVSYLRVLAVADYWDEERLWYTGDTEEFQKLLNSTTTDISFTLPYTSIYTNRSGFVCRAVNAPDARQFTATLIVNRNLKNEFWLPISSFSLGEYSNYNNKSKELDRSIKYLFDNGFKDATLLDFDYMFPAVASFFALQQKFQQHLGYTGTTHLKFKLMNVWRRIPLISASPTDLCWDKYGVPMILTDNVVSEKGGALESFHFIKMHSEIANKSDFLNLSTPFFLNLMMAAGLGVGNVDDFSALVIKAIGNSMK